MIVVVSVLIMAVEPLTSNVGVLMALRVLRALKPLRMLTRSEEMRIVVKSLMLSVVAMANVSLFCLLFFVIFAILGTQLFMGLFSRCGNLCTWKSDVCKSPPDCSTQNHCNSVAAHVLAGAMTTQSVVWKSVWMTSSTQSLSSCNLAFGPPLSQTLTTLAARCWCAS